MFNKKMVIFTLSILLFLLLLYSTALSQFKPTLSNLATKSDMIVKAEIEQIDCRWNKSKTLIYSYIKVKPLEILKGNTPGEITIIKTGGKIGKKSLSVSHAPVFNEGETVLLFLEKYKNNLHTVTEAEQGKFTIKNEMLINYRGETEEPTFLEDLSRIISAE